MKVRNGFVSNSSSSSFILRRSALSSEQEAQVLAFFDKRGRWYETELEKVDDEYFRGDLEAHNNANCSEWDGDCTEGEPTDTETASVLFDELMDDFGITNKDYVNRYEDYVGPQDIGGKHEDSDRFC